MESNPSSNHVDTTKEERKELEIEYEKLKIERIKAWGSILSIPMSFIVAALTIFYGIWSMDVNSKINFEMKAAEIVMNSNSPDEAANKAIALKKLFPNRLPSNFADAFVEIVFDDDDLRKRNSSGSNSP